MKIKGADHEINFWKDFVKTDRFLEGWAKDVKTPELNDIVYGFLVGHPKAKVLDCGSGVVSILNGTVKNDDLIVCDLLGDEYAKIFNYELMGCKKPEPYGCEDLPYENEFDIVHISNALDHTQDVLTSYNKLLGAVKKGGFLIIQGFENEGLQEKWQGFHQWNLSVTETGTLRVEHKSGKIDYIDSGLFFKKIWIEMLGREWFIFIVQK
jgi:hypothetical protein